MRHLLIFILGLSFFLGSCSREDFVDNSIPDEIIIPPSEEVEVGDINGIVKGNNGELLSSAVVKLYNETELISETTSNSFGEFNFVDVLQNDVYKVFVHKDSYNASIVFISDDHFDNEELEIDLFFGTVLSAIGQPTDLLDPNYILMYGSILDAEGDNVNSSIFIITDDANFLYQNDFKDGNYAVLIPKDKEVIVYLLQTSGCQIFPEENYLGPYDSDVKVDFQSTELLISESFSGFVSVCDSSFLQSGTLEYYSSNDESTQVPIVDGFFEFEFEGCEFSDFHYQIFDEFDNILYSGFFELGTNFYQIDIECNITSFEPGTANLTYNNGQSVIEYDVFALSESTFNQIFIFANFQLESESSFSLSFVNGNSNSAIVDQFSVDIENNRYFIDQEIPVIINYDIEANSSSLNFGELYASFNATLTDFTGFNKIEISMVINTPIFFN